MSLRPACPYLQSMANSSRHDPLIRPSHRPLRNALRVVGPVLIVIGLGFMLVGLLDFFTTAAQSIRSGPGFGPSSGFPTKFWCLFVGMPLLAVGAWLSMAGFAGSFLRYAASESSPVAKDSFNYLAQGTGPGVQELSRNIATGIRGAIDDEPAVAEPIACPACGADNDPGSRFCDQCGANLPAELPCPACQTLNDADAKFCDHCGEALAASGLG